LAPCVRCVGVGVALRCVPPLPGRAGAGRKPGRTLECHVKLRSSRHAKDGMAAWDSKQRGTTTTTTERLNLVRL
jgi:hypothetical protein